ncbi:MAG: SAM-dependent methyltransferase, partial [Chloroflexi bacterium]|nr:SAM-dependent methyltransferase [Chloroflexota bacterium]
EGYRGEVDLALEDWAAQVGEALERGFMLTIDYGEPAQDLYSAANAQGTLVCFQEHDISDDPYQHPGQQDITSQVDFTSLMRLGEQAGLRTAGYTTQRQFLEGLGFWERLEGALEQEMSYAHRELMRMAMMSLVDPEGLGSLKALAQSKGLGPGVELLGFRTVSSTP